MIQRRLLIGALLAVSICAARPAVAGDPKYEYRDPPKPEVKPWVYKANASLGLIWAAGNSQSIGVSGNALFGFRHFNDAFELFGQGAYVQTGSSSFGAGGPINTQTTSTELWLARARYDRFFFDKNTVFAAFQVSGDKPAGYWYRLEPQVGYARLLFKSIHQTLRTEIGYDYTREHQVAFPPVFVDYHSLRAFIFYENKFTPYASFSEGCELLWAMNNIDSVRVNSLTSLSSTISKNVSLKLNFTVKFNNTPPPRPGNLMMPDGMGGMEPAMLGNNTTLDKVDTVLEAVVAVTFL